MPWSEMSVSLKNINISTCFECPCSCSVPQIDKFVVTFCYSERKRRNTMYFVFQQYRMVVIQGILGQGTGWISVSWVTFCKFWGFQTYSCEVRIPRFLFLTYKKWGNQSNAAVPCTQMERSNSNNVCDSVLHWHISESLLNQADLANVIILW